MRTRGTSHRDKRTRHAAALACALLALLPAAAAADPRYAKPVGGATAGPCTADDRCDLEYAIEVAAQSGETVWLTGGTYTVTSKILTARTVTISAEPGEHPVIAGTAGLGTPVLTVSDGASEVRGIEFRAGNTQPALDLTGTGAGLQVYSDHGTALALGDGSTLENTVAHTSAAGATALDISAGLGSATTLRHATVAATGTGSTAIEASGLASTVYVRSSIANGAGSDVVGSLLNPVDLRYSAWRPTASTYATGAPGNGNVDGVAVFENVALRNFQQRFTSPTVNAGEPNGTTASLDVAGRQRVMGAQPDMGAHELLLAPTAATGAATPGATSATVGATTNPRTVSTQYWVEYGTSGALDESTAPVAAGAGAVDVSRNFTLTGLLPGTNYDYRTVAQNELGRTEGSVETFRTTELAPVPATAAATDVTAAGASLQGSADRGGAATTAWFEWGETTGYGNRTPDQDLGAGPGSASLAGTAVAGLTPNTVYHYRVIARNAEGEVQSGDATFRTTARTPQLTLAAPTGVTEDGVALGGTVDPGGGDTTWRFDYGVGNYDNPTDGGTLGGTSVQPVAQTLTGLDPGSVYSYRLSAENSGGNATMLGTFTTEIAPPRAETGDSAEITATSALVGGQAYVGGGAGEWRVEYGTTAGYGRTSAKHQLARSVDDQDVMTTLTGLEPATTYHYRFVATNAKGSGAGADQTFTTAAPPPPPPPGPDPNPGPGPDADDAREPAPEQKQADGLPAPDPTPPVGRAANAVPAGGTIRVRVPGSNEYVTLTQGAGIPMGSVVDATAGQVTITSAADAHGRTQSANFGGGEFKVLQKRTARPVTDIVLSGPFGCTPRALAKGLDTDVFAAGRRKWSRRSLWGNGHGRFRTRGRRAAATVRGTHWLTEDRCDGTLVRVKRGLVEVRDLGLRKTVMVPAGKQYVAKNPGTGAGKSKRPRKRPR